MTNEKWWEDEEYCKEENGNCSNEECWYKSYDVEKIVAEAMRRGKAEAWEEASTMLKHVKQKFRCAACDGASNLSHTHTCSVFAEIEAKLTSLKTP
jgi:hypothetical protein